MKCKILYWFVVCCVGLSRTLDYIPKSREIEVLDNGAYTFGFDENDNSTNISLISYSSDTGIIGEFVVTKHKPTDKVYLSDNTEMQVERNQVTHNGRVGLCTLNVAYVSDAGPKVWTLLPYQDGKIFSPITFNINFFYNAQTLIKDAVSVVEGASFLQYLLMPNIQWKQCVLKIDNIEIKLNLTSTNTHVFLSSFVKDDEDTAERIRSLGHGLCGFQLINATTSMSTISHWTLTGIDNTDKAYRGTFKVVVTKKPNTSIVQKVILGDWTIWTCGVETPKQTYCALYNPSGKLIMDGRTCTYKTETVSIDDIGKWMCITGIRDSMDTEDYTVDVINKGTEIVETWVQEDLKYVSMGCRLKYATSDTISFCRMVAPNNKMFNILPGGATDRYLSLGTNFSESTCAIQIEKPLTPNEIGLWRCEMSAGIADVTGGFLKVGEVILPNYPKYKQITTQLEKPFTILCEVPYSSEYCHITAPNGSSYETENAYRTRLGRCSFTVKAATTNDNGTWFCSFAREMGTPDEKIAIEIIIAEVLVYYTTVQVRAGGTAELMCSTGGLPINYCRFIHPSGNAYHVHNHQSSKTISYNGRGLEYGECGISINKVQTYDTGTWTCVTRIGKSYKQPEITAHINLFVSPNYFEDPNIAAAVGISIGVVIVSVIAGFMAFRKWKQRRNAELENSPHTRLINDGNNVAFSFPNPATSSTVQESHEHQP